MEPEVEKEPPVIGGEGPAVLTEASAEERAMTQLKTVFGSVDKNTDGLINKAELADALKRDPKLGALIKEAGMDQSFANLDKLETKTPGCINWDEFQASLKAAAVEEVLDTGNVAAVELAADEKAFQELKKIYEALDSNKDGAVSREELALGLKQDPNINHLIEEAGLNTEYYVLEQIDDNGDGRITWDEFESHLRKAAKEQVKDTGKVAAADVLAPEPEVEAVIQPKGIWCSC